MPEINKTHLGSSINDETRVAKLQHSKFTLSPKLAITSRFGEITPFFCLDTVPDDRLQGVRTIHKASTYTLKVPLKDNVKLHKDFFHVPLSSILPFNWEKIISNPVQGDDVPEDANCLVSIHFLNLHLDDCFLNLGGQSDQQDAEETFKIVFNNLIDIESLLSSGCLMATLGYGFYQSRAWRRLYNPVTESPFRPASLDNRFLYDDVLQSILDYIKEYVVSFVVTDGSSVYRVCIGNDTLGYYTEGQIATNEINISFHRFLELMRDGFWITSCQSVTVNGIDPDDLAVGLVNMCRFYFYTETTALGAKTRNYVVAEFDENDKFDFGPLYAYQILCAHYYTNDHIDYVYTAELYRQLINSINHDINSVTDSFSFNGLDVPYDYLSEHFVDAIFLDGSYYHLRSILGFNRSLRYADMITGSKSRPLAIGDTNIAVDSYNNVSVIDVSQKIQVQRFLNAVNRAGSKISNYIKSIFGTDLKYDYHDPMYLVALDDSLNPQYNENTASEMFSNPQSVTSVITGSSNKYAFDYNPDRFGYIIGVFYLDVERHYIGITDAQRMFVDRYDRFNPYMQYIGDQPYKKCLLSMYPGDYDNPNIDKPFSYMTKDTCYKQMVNRAVGAFALSDLDNYIFVADKFPEFALKEHISPSYIRSNNDEFDRFYVSLTGDTLGKYFHFIFNFDTFVDAYRPMVAQPNIL